MASHTQQIPNIVVVPDNNNNKHSSQEGTLLLSSLSPKYESRTTILARDNNLQDEPQHNVKMNQNNGSNTNIRSSNSILDVLASDDCLPLNFHISLRPLMNFKHLVEQQGDRQQPEESIFVDENKRMLFICSSSGILVKMWDESQEELLRFLEFNPPPQTFNEMEPSD